VLTMCVAMRGAWGRDERRGAWAGDGVKEGALRVGMWGDTERQHMARHARISPLTRLLTSHPITAPLGFPLQSFPSLNPESHRRHACDVPSEPPIVRLVPLWCLQLACASIHSIPGTGN